MTTAHDFAQRLAQWPAMADVFNPWSQADERDRPGANAALIRRQQLAAYIDARRSKARVILIAEALSCRGGRFTGIAMTSERILLGNDTVLNRLAASSDASPPPDYLPGRASRTSNPGELSRGTDREYGVYERTASIVWRTMLANGFGPMEFALWNAFPFHPFITGNAQSNRRPSGCELRETGQILPDFIGLFPHAVWFVALGREAESALPDHLAPSAVKHARHPAARAIRPSESTSRGKESPMRMLGEVIREIAQSGR
ncbi:uracil-DNA glycosylase [Paraburkholderia sp.]|uniref:uracil-DNA glycosylase n=1 Tax=Paraburkholderia sp. TaxID=1926495 RepID=UPI0039E57ED9